MEKESKGPKEDPMKQDDTEILVGSDRSREDQIPESSTVQNNPEPSHRGLSQQPRLTPLYQQPDAIVRAVLGDLTDLEIAQYRAQCTSRRVRGDKMHRCQQDSLEH